MTSEGSSELRTRNGATAAERTAAELGSFVADEVRTAIESAERSAEELRRSALDDAEADRGHIHRSAAVVRDRIDAVEAQVGRLLDDLREEVARIVEQAERALEERSAVAEPPAVAEEPHRDGSKPQRRRGLFRRRRRALPQCSVCGRAAEEGDDDLEQWRRAGRVSLCPGCQADGWQVPEGASVPYRSSRGREG
jgi:hypothetical protein